MQRRRILCTWAANLLAAAMLVVPASAAELIPMGQAVGIEAETEGLLVTGFTEVETAEGTVSPAKDAGMQVGDVIRILDGKEIGCAEDLREALSSAGTQAVVRFDRGGLEKRCTVHFAFSEEGTAQMGVMLRDGVTGIGTVTYCDPETGSYGALGHGINDEESGALLPIRSGTLTLADISGVKSPDEGAAGSLLGAFADGEIFGDVEENTVFGIFGNLTAAPDGQTVETLSDEEIQPGPAVIRSTVSGGEVREYDVTIDRVYRENGCTRFLLTVTDEDLLAAAGGIVQGMSGSPILQDGQLIGAVTHVLLEDSAKGYGVSIDTMLKAAEALDNAA